MFAREMETLCNRDLQCASPKIKEREKVVRQLLKTLLELPSNAEMPASLVGTRHWNPESEHS